ncbi:MAG: phosphoribosylaminoimidazolesuccinocarboxamide synthase [Acidobacteria bacterium]|nr:phosphoribosylaminoimidazolesuccinocarboxamide synthase [Acidobacteriota bacterium]
MPRASTLIDTSFAGLRLLGQGKVRDMYDLGDVLIMVATDRISAFDYVLANGIPDKGKVLTQLSAFWFDKLAAVVPNHLLSMRPEEYPAEARPYAEPLRGRSMLVRKTTPLPIECVVRGYLSGSGWKEYKQTGEVCGIPLPRGLLESDRLPAPLFTPATKAETGHDINISEARAGEIIGAALIARLRDLSLELYRRGAEHAEGRGIIVADTKFEFGLVEPIGSGEDDRDRVMLIDEALTPDSSRFWPSDAYRPGESQPSFDKQYVRDYLEQIKWNKQPPVPALPDLIVERTRQKYIEAFRGLTGRELE